MKKNVIRIVLILMIIGWMSIVFGFSNDNAETSSSLSLEISRIISYPISNTFSTSGEEMTIFIEPIIRKIAHLSEYTVGGILFFGLFYTFNLDYKKQVIFSIVLGFLYAISDEIHQLFIPGRSGQIEDVIIDSIGVTLGVFILSLIIKIIENIKRD